MIEIVHCHAFCHFHFKKLRRELVFVKRVLDQGDQIFRLKLSCGNINGDRKVIAFVIPNPCLLACFIYNPLSDINNETGFFSNTDEFSGRTQLPVGGDKAYQRFCPCHFLILH